MIRLILLCLLLPSLACAQIIVPVTITYQGKSVTAPMAIDTGATTTTIDTRLADRLGIKPESAGFAQMADGRMVPYRSAAMTVTVSDMARTIKVNIMDYSANRKAMGMLGLNYLDSMKITIDWKRQRVYWSE